MKKKNILPLFAIISFILGLFLYFKYEDLALMILCFFIPVFITLIITYIEYEKVTTGNDYVMLSKRKVPTDWKWTFFIVVIMISFKNLTVYSGILIILIIIYAFLAYTMSKRRTFTINMSGVKELNIQEKKREISEITHFEIYGNNVEMRFNTNEFLQINKSELLYPKWDIFTSQMNELKLYINLQKEKE
ncbi:hypothetical protein [Dokdonia pacifica]|uniref:Uncharacterized protein n=1 Tax=Dokdonia pacifica TaxID=1627892 RepID=A0A238WB99_9FLAO|nr:hypothetical protein [Dokdonia pacifica]SNR43768.1 hypothetical protein SAMN06265376_101894 [Dokdonia pacifica]